MRNDGGPYSLVVLAKAVAELRYRAVHLTLAGCQELLDLLIGCLHLAIGVVALGCVRRSGSGSLLSLGAACNGYGLLLCGHGARLWRCR